MKLPSLIPPSVALASVLTSLSASLPAPAVAFFSASVLMLGAACAEIPDAVHPDFDLKELRMPAYYKTMGLAFLKDGTMVLATTETIGGGEVPDADPLHKVFLIKGASTDTLPAFIKEISNTWKQLSGVTVAEDRVFVSDRDGFYEIPDLANPADLVANRRAVAKWPNENHWNNGPYWHQWAFTPQYLNGAFYAPYSGSIAPGGRSNVDPTSPLSGAFLKWDFTGKLEAFAGGLRSPNGAALDPGTGEIFGTDNQGSWLPSSTFMRIRQGRFYGHRQTLADLDADGNLVGNHPANFAESLPYEPPVAWLPHGTVRSSPSQPVMLTQGRFAGDWLIGDVNNPGLVRVALDKVGDGYNGGGFWFSKGTSNGAINRMARAPDGSIIIGTITRIGGNWPGGDKSPMFKLTAKEPAAAFDFKSVRALADGLELEFTQPVNPDSVSPGHFQVRSWQYIRQKEYGIGRQPDETREVIAAEASKDRKRVHLSFSAMATDRVYYVKLTGVASSGGKGLWNNESWFTLNAIPNRVWDGGSPTAISSPPPFRSNVSMNAKPRQGNLEVTFACGAAVAVCSGNVSAALYSSAGVKLAEATGRLGAGAAPLRFAQPESGPGIRFLKAEIGVGSYGASPGFPAGGSKGNVSVTQRVFF